MGFGGWEKTLIAVCSLHKLATKCTLELTLIPAGVKLWPGSAGLHHHGQHCPGHHMAGPQKRWPTHMNDSPNAMRVRVCPLSLFSVTTGFSSLLSSPDISSRWLEPSHSLSWSVRWQALDLGQLLSQRSQGSPQCKVQWIFPVSPSHDLFGESGYNALKPCLTSLPLSESQSSVARTLDRPSCAPLSFSRLICFL